MGSNRIVLSLHIPAEWKQNLSFNRTVQQHFSQTFPLDCGLPVLRERAFLISKGLERVELIAVFLHPNSFLSLCSMQYQSITKDASKPQAYQQSWFSGLLFYPLISGCKRARPFSTCNYSIKLPSFKINYLYGLSELRTELGFKIF